MRGAVVRYRVLFEELVGGGSAKPVVEPAFGQAKNGQAKPADRDAVVPAAAGNARYDPR